MIPFNKISKYLYDIINSKNILQLNKTASSPFGNNRNEIIKPTKFL